MSETLKIVHELWRMTKSSFAFGSIAFALTLWSSHARIIRACAPFSRRLVAGSNRLARPLVVAVPIRRCLAFTRTPVWSLSLSFTG